MIRDRNIGYKYMTEFTAAENFNSFAGTVNSLSSTAALVHAGGDRGYSALEMNHADDEARIVRPVPSHWDVNNDIFFRVIYLHEAGATPAIAYIVTWKTNAFGSVITATVADQTLANPIASDTATGSDAVDATPWGKLNGGTMDRSAGMLTIDVKGGATSDMIGLEIAFIPKFTSQPQNNDQADPTDV